MDWDNNLEKNKIENLKNGEHKSRNDMCEQKPLARKRIFVQTPSSISILKLEQKIFTKQNHLLLRSTSRFSMRNINSSLEFKNHKCV